ncbi:hypothetical protein E2562_018299 [Oryza meyeriana var. granulata]|uniref:Retrotransposon Copia-like N-terminal domain-containing protein n=1 Tax=Oryza meyeriana var. granulata TaxID=110450 RepID=A0A6G1CRI2_9ORYZ|nr:hypothetical protein E2562_018299 [Oryza meyeriana var. granulata]
MDYMYLQMGAPDFLRSRVVVPSALAQGRPCLPLDTGIRSVYFKPEIFDESNFKRWQARAKLWLMDQKLFWVISSPPKGTLDGKARSEWEDATNAAIARLLAVLSNRLFDIYVTYTDAKKLWDELDQKYSEGDNGNELFTTATYLNY